VNLGTPESPELHDVQSYLREFLSDRRIVSMPSIVWKPILEGIILRTHAVKSADKYASVWMDGGSPLLIHVKDQASGLQQRMPDVRIEYAMRYGHPRLPWVLDTLEAEGFSDVLVVPAYPQYSTTTVETVFDVLNAYLVKRDKQRRTSIKVATIRDWHEDDGYIEALVRRVEQAWEAEGRPDFASGDRLLLSFHGIPVSLAKTEPYEAQCRRTADLLRGRLGVSERECLLTFQSKFGKGKWLAPATLDTVGALGRSGVRRLDVFCPGFVCDCLETLEEIDQLNRDAFEDAGGGHFVHIPCLNELPEWLDAWAAIIRAELVRQRMDSGAGLVQSWGGSDRAC
jgi:ferrochelatase